MNFVADTDVLIDFLRGRTHSSDYIVREIKSGKLCTTSITAFELWSGVKGAKESEAIETLLAALTIFPLDAPSAKMASEVRRNLDLQGKAIGMADSLIAGICVYREATLMTRNKKHFSRVRDLKLHEQKSVAE